MSVATPVIPFENTYSKLPDRFYARLEPTPVAEPQLLFFNEPLAKALGLDRDGLDESMIAQVLSGNRLPEAAEPLAQAYAGHQFGNFVPQLGDGRAILLGEVVDRSGRRLDIQLKGAGVTPFSRGGDGRAALGPVLREYLVSEAMHALGVPTTRALAAVSTGEPVYRDSVLPGAVLTRVAASHIRVGTFQYFTARGDIEAVRVLADYVIERHYPALAEADNPYLALLETVIERQASLITEWMRVGFIHGVMNTDNTAIAGETIDYGPCAFMDKYNRETVFSSIDHGGRYAFGNQPSIGYWNMARFAETLVPLLDDDENQALEMATEAVHGFPNIYQDKWRLMMGQKLGLSAIDEMDAAFIYELLDLMEAHGADYTLTFRKLGDSLVNPKMVEELKADFGGSDEFGRWLGQWAQHRQLDALDSDQQLTLMASRNPVYIPRNHRVEEALAAAVKDDDYGPFRQLQQVLESPYTARAGLEPYTEPPPADFGPYRTFCGT